MKKKIIIVISVLAVIILSTLVFRKDHTYPKINTGVHADWLKNSADNRFDDLIIKNEIYSVPCRDNIYLRATDNAERSEAVFNFGENDQYTMYEMKTELKVKVYADSKNKLIFCNYKDEQAVLDHYLDYNNYNFSVYKSKFDKPAEIKIKNDFLNELNRKYRNAEHRINLNGKLIKQYRIIPISKDGLVKRDAIIFAEYKGKIYFAAPFTYVELEDEEREYLREVLLKENI